MNIPLLDTVGGIFKGVLGIVDQVVEDKDKRNEITYKIFEAQNQLNVTILTQKTVPWIDAAVKFLYALNSLWRPLVSAYLFFYGLTHPEVLRQLYEMGPAGQAGIGAMFAAFPGWMYSRHKKK